MDHARRGVLVLNWAIRLAECEKRKWHQIEQRLLEAQTPPHGKNGKNGKNSKAALSLADQLTNRDWHVRLETAKRLGEARTPEVGEALVKLLEDENLSVRWKALEGLVNMRRGAVRPLLEALTRDFDSICLRRSAHQLLHTLHKHGVLSPAEMAVFHSLEASLPAIQVAQIANRALIARRMEQAENR